MRIPKYICCRLNANKHTNLILSLRNLFGKIVKKTFCSCKIVNNLYAGCPEKTVGRSEGGSRWLEMKNITNIETADAAVVNHLSAEYITKKRRENSFCLVTIENH